MKKLFVSLLFSLLTISVFSQDLIVNRARERFDGFILSDNKRELVLRMRNPDGSTTDTTFAASDIYDKQYNVTAENKDASLLDNRNAISLGLAAAGSTIVGVEYERLFSPYWSAQIGVGLAGASIATAFHFQPTVNSSFLSLNCWLNGFLDKDNLLGYHYIMIGPAFTYRANRWFYASFGAGAIVDKGPAIADWNDKSPIGINISLGTYVGF